MRCLTNRDMQDDEHERLTGLHMASQTGPNASRKGMESFTVSGNNSAM